MATITKPIEGEQASFPYQGFGRLFVLEKEVDLQALGAGNGDVVNVFNIPAGTVLLGCAVKMERPASGSGTAGATLGTGSAPSGLHNSINLKSSEYQLGATPLRVGTDDIVSLTISVTDPIDDMGKAIVKVAAIQFF